MVVDQLFPKTQAKDGSARLVKASGKHIATLGKLTRIFEVTLCMSSQQKSLDTETEMLASDLAKRRP